jgi:uncharacterized membrane protein
LTIGRHGELERSGTSESDSKGEEDDSVRNDSGELSRFLDTDSSDELDSLARNGIRRRTSPLPSASELAEYKQIGADLPNRIFTMAEEEQRHRFKMQEQELKQPYVLARRGQLFGLLSLAFLVSLAVYLAYLHQPGWAVSLGSLDFVAIVAVFVGAGASRRAILRRGVYPASGPRVRGKYSGDEPGKALSEHSDDFPPRISDDPPPLEEYFEE